MLRFLVLLLGLIDYFMRYNIKFEKRKETSEVKEKFIHFFPSLILK